MWPVTIIKGKFLWFICGWWILQVYHKNQTFP
jgi:hypothetical protein